MQLLSSLIDYFFGVALLWWFHSLKPTDNLYITILKNVSTDRQDTAQSVQSLTEYILYCYLSGVFC